MKIILMFGMPGSGKTTIGKEIAEKLGYYYISSGDIARRCATGDELRQLDAGMMFTEDKMRVEILNIIMSHNRSKMNMVLDGFPRFMDQYQWFITMLRESGIDGIDITNIVIDSPLIESIDRAIKRNRSDYGNTTKRVQYYIENTLPVIFSINVGKIIRINNDDDYHRCIYHIIHEIRESEYRPQYTSL